MSLPSYPVISTTPINPPATTYGGTQPPPPPLSDPNLHLRLRYAIALSLGFIIILSALLLISFLCRRRPRRRQNPNPSSSTPSDNGIILPRVIFVAEDDGDEDSQNLAMGLDQSVINSYPKFPFSKGNENESACAICLCEYKESEMLRMLPECRHYFHLTCIDAWLKLNASCPVCRNSPLPTPLSTPLSEVVPLSLYSDGRNQRRW